MNTFRTRTRSGAAILFSGILVLGGLAVAGDASAEQEGDNPSCVDLGYDFGQKWENPSGSYTVDRDGMKASFTVGTYDDDTDDVDPNPNNAITAASIDTKADGYAVVVKGGDGYNLYPNTEAVPMHAPAVSSDKWPTISHFQLCWNEPAPQPQVGQLQVTKAVTGEGAPTDVEFTVCIEGLSPLDPVTTKQCQMVKDDNTVTFQKLVPGTYTVTETDPGTEYTVKITPTDTPEVTAGGITKITVTNAFTAPTTPPPEEEVVPPAEEPLPPTQEALPPTTPDTPTAPVTPAAPTQVASQQSALPATGSEGGLAAIAVVLVAAGVGFTLLSKRHGPQQA